ncbi:hypothetical protein [Helicobacter japonicus]|uniref:hypothetical protein n=1 Tax=Helicobacter japonicus TaxID=425400 RepID=UPI0023F2CF38|nr:hypothetical protein [Helicobacter japonicus]
MKIDGGVEQDDINKKCDFLVIKTTNEDIWIYIELKGNKLEDACKQIQATYDKYKQSNALKYIAIVASRFPKGDTSIQDLKESLKKRGVKKIFHKEVTLELTYNRNDFKNPIKKTN